MKLSSLIKKGSISLALVCLLSACNDEIDGTWRSILSTQGAKTLSTAVKQTSTGNVVVTSKASSRIEMKIDKGIVSYTTICLYPDGNELRPSVSVPITVNDLYIVPTKSIPSIAQSPPITSLYSNEVCRTPEFVAGNEIRYQLSTKGQTSLVLFFHGEPAIAFARE
jgi:hypothetical protein